MAISAKELPRPGFMGRRLNSEEMRRIIPVMVKPRTPAVTPSTTTEANAELQRPARFECE